MCIRIVLYTACAACLVAGRPVPAVGQSPATQLIEDPAAVESDADSAGSGAAADIEDMLKLDIEQLGKVDVVVPSMDVEVTSVTRTESTVGRSPAAIFVITPEMIRRSGATCVPEVLRMVPGMEVARITASQWAISCRGFNDQFANKLLVQIDGRSIYSPIMSGVLWESHTVMLENVERIEVIRGPGATVWGANAVNGVINIITKDAEDTQGLLIGGMAGNELRGYTKLRYGGTLGQNFSWRAYGLQFDRDQGTLPDRNAADDWRKVQTGFRADWEPTGCDKVTFQGDCHYGMAGLEYNEQMPVFPYGQRVSDDLRLGGGNALARWSRDLGEDRGWALQLYYDHFERHITTLSDCSDAVDIDFQQEFPLGQRHKLVWGSRYRYYRIRTEGSFTFSFDPPGRDVDLFSYFLQDQITLSPDRLFLTLGSKVEHNDYTAFEFQPTARLLWSPDSRRAVWGAVSRAVRTPSLFYDDVRLKTQHIYVGPPPPAFIELRGNRASESEDLLAYEIGYRAQPDDTFHWDVALFFNKYEDLLAYVQTPPSPTPPIWPWIITNSLNGETYGGELTATWEVNPCWRVTGYYSYRQFQLHPGPSGETGDLPNGEASSPHNQVYCRSSWDLAYDLEFDMTLRYVDSVESSSIPIPSYFTMDLRLGWHPSERFEAAVVGQNLLDSHHAEFSGSLDLATQVGRSVYGTVTWRF